MPYGPSKLADVCVCVIRPLLVQFPPNEIAVKFKWLFIAPQCIRAEGYWHLSSVSTTFP